ncbi:MAG: hypothetical protein COS89_01040 [Deltaproteobacteria bacterium CG07_land_8_20_14_0_80_38_7]|nr:MAG: hypothetical protein COS89_01040 [Deltaproteobacteria bacterium CG07_land_8_20_14_0_80_38_7]
MYFCGEIDNNIPHRRDLDAEYERISALYEETIRREAGIAAEQNRDVFLPDNTKTSASSGWLLNT